MARFIASIQGARGPAQRLGNATTGISSHTRGWDLGASAHLFVNGELRTPSGKVKDPGFDVLSLQITSGSNGRRTLLDLGDWYRLADGTLCSASPRAELILNAIRKET